MLIMLMPPLLRKSRSGKREATPMGSTADLAPVEVEKLCETTPTTRKRARRLAAAAMMERELKFILRVWGGGFDEGMKLCGANGHSGPKRGDTRKWKIVSILMRQL
jgi:hypothetical protein